MTMIHNRCEFLFGTSSSANGKIYDFIFVKYFNDFIEILAKHLWCLNSYLGETLSESKTSGTNSFVEHNDLGYG